MFYEFLFYKKMVQLFCSKPYNQLIFGCFLPSFPVQINTESKSAYCQSVKW